MKLKDVWDKVAGTPGKKIAIGLALPAAGVLGAVFMPAAASVAAQVGFLLGLPFIGLGVSDYLKVKLGIDDNQPK